jgi:hypothetical protein
VLRLLHQLPAHATSKAIGKFSAKNFMPDKKKQPENSLLSMLSSDERMECFMQEQIKKSDMSQQFVNVVSAVDFYKKHTFEGTKAIRKLRDICEVSRISLSFSN